jgi:hypothetical protein
MPVRTLRLVALIPPTCDADTGSDPGTDPGALLNDSYALGSMSPRRAQIKVNHGVGKVAKWGSRQRQQRVHL